VVRIGELYVANVKIVGAGTLVGTGEIVGYDRYSPYVALYSGTLKTINVQGYPINNGNIKVAIYSNNAGSPGTVLAQVGSTPIVKSQVTTISIADVELAKDTTYWLAHIVDTDDSVVEKDGSGPASKRGGIKTYSTFTFQNNPSIAYTYPAREWGCSGWGTVLGGVGFVGDGLVGEQVFFGPEKFFG